MATTVAALLAKILVRIEACIDNPFVDYRIGNISVSGSQYLDYLLKIKTDLETNSITPEECVVHYSHVISEFGVDQSEIMNGA